MKGSTAMTPDTYYTIRRIHSSCQSQSEVLFDLTYRRVWRTELGDQGQWCDLLVEQKEVETGHGLCATSGYLCKAV
jgi:hypothetical protein